VSEISSQQIRSWTGVLSVNKFLSFSGKKGSFWKKNSKENLTNFAKFLEKYSKFCKYFIYQKIEKKKT